MSIKFFGTEPDYSMRRSLALPSKVSCLTTTHSAPQLATSRSKLRPDIGNEMECVSPHQSELSFPGIQTLREKIHLFLDRPLSSIARLGHAEVARDLSTSDFMSLNFEELGYMGRYIELDHGRGIVKRLSSSWHAAGETAFRKSMFNTVIAAGSGDQLIDRGAAYVPCTSGAKVPDVLYGCDAPRPKPQGYNSFYSTASVAFEIEYAHLTVERLKDKFRAYFSVDYPLNILVGLKIEYVPGQNPGPNTPCTVLYTDRHIYPRIVERETVMGHPVLLGPEPGFPQFPVIDLPLPLIYHGVENPPVTQHSFDLQNLVALTYRYFPVP